MIYLTNKKFLDKFKELHCAEILYYYFKIGFMLLYPGLKYIKKPLVIKNKILSIVVVMSSRQSNTVVFFCPIPLRFFFIMIHCKRTSMWCLCLFCEL